MKSLKALLIAATVAAASTLTGCGTVAQIVDRGNNLRDADPVGYELITGENDYRSVTPVNFVHGS